MISVAAELAHMHPQTLRIYEARGLIEPKRSPKNTRLYSQRDVERLRRIQQMTSEEGLNLAGVETVLELEERVEKLSAELERARRRAEELEADAQGRTELMQPDRFTVKSQEAVAAAQQLAAERRNPEVAPAHLLVALLARRTAWSCRSCRSSAPTRRRSAPAPHEAVEALPTLGEAAEVRACPRPWRRRCSRPRTRWRSSATSTSRPSTSCWR